jgi:hypothetical protein
MATFSFNFFAVHCIIIAIKCPVVYEVVNNVVNETDICRINSHVIVQSVWRYRYLISQRKQKHYSLFYYEELNILDSIYVFINIK